MMVVSLLLASALAVAETSIQSQVVQPSAAPSASDGAASPAVDQGAAASTPTAQGVPESTGKPIQFGVPNARNPYNLNRAPIGSGGGGSRLPFFPFFPGPSSFDSFSDGETVTPGGGGGSWWGGRGGGVSNSLEYRQESAGTNKYGGEMVFVNGCAKDAGKFQLAYGNPGAGCDERLKMSRTLADFLDRTLNRCVGEAVGATVTGGGKIYHAGVIGDARHQRTGSLHNLGLAIDIKAIEVGGQRFTIANKDARTRNFVAKLRQCWGNAADRERNGCLTDNGRGHPPGTIGEEDHNHQGHLHLSVPLCPQVAAAKGIYRASFISLLLNQALAESTSPLTAKAEPALGPEEKLERKEYSIKGGRVQVDIRDVGEPVGAPLRLKVQSKCGKLAAKVIASEIEACSVGAVKDGELLYKTSQMTDGELRCEKQERIRVVCP
jgi:hypothetical protein